ncbi:hypothetical protein NLG97_g4857 [Lecanicillium saksenae]|uniref:Uncharacterized protein n=1 Tax=Lecanicillium saksenae TaxID=468837 RepID=A0ACC1QU33_9HYPO|nr:hypothetical protein NLG97_g4857 [Lecanicillium saksenae]
MWPLALDNPTLANDSAPPVANPSKPKKRARRVKCDEATPICRRCLTGQFSCRYGALIPLGAAKHQFGEPIEGHGMDLRDVRRQQSCEKRIFVEVEPFSWDYQQAIRFYFEFIGPIRGKVGRHPSFLPTSAERFIMLVINTQVGNIAKKLGRNLPFGDSAAPSTLWGSYARYHHKILKLVNHYIRDETPLGKANTINYIALLIIADYSLESKMWRTHTDGGFAYLESIGGVQTMIDLSTGPRHPFSKFLRYSLAHNMTIPALDHVRGSEHYTDEQLALLLYEDFFYEEQPYPVPLMIIEISLTRLRNQLATTTISSDDLAGVISDLFKRLEKVDIDGWAQKIDGFGPAINQALAELNRDAIWLYAMLTLPRAAMRRWASEQPQAQYVATGVDPYNYFRSLYTSRLLAALRLTHPALPYPSAANQALVIAGVAVASCGSKEDQEFVDRCLYSNWLRPIGNGQVIHRLWKLREFWASGKTGWDDCFYEPTPG